MTHGKVPTIRLTHVRCDLKTVDVKRSITSKTMDLALLPFLSPPVTTVCRQFVRGSDSREYLTGTRDQDEEDVPRFGARIDATVRSRTQRRNAKTTLTTFVPLQHHPDTQRKRVLWHARREISGSPEQLQWVEKVAMWRRRVPADINSNLSLHVHGQIIEHGWRWGGGGTWRRGFPVPVVAQVSLAANVPQDGNANDASSEPASYGITCGKGRIQSEAHHPSNKHESTYFG